MRSVREGQEIIHFSAMEAKSDLDSASFEQRDLRDFRAVFDSKWERSMELNRSVDLQHISNRGTNWCDDSSKKSMSMWDQCIAQHATGSGFDFEISKGGSIFNEVRPFASPI